MSTGLAELTAAGDPSQDAIDAFVGSQRFPLVEGNTVTFIYRGPGEQVNLRHWIYGLPSGQPFIRVGQTDLWHVALELPEQSRVEYKIEVVENGNARWILDPLNPHRASDPFGANSVCHGQGYAVPEWTHQDEETRPGSFEKLTVSSTAFGDDRHLRVYLPARFRRRARYPLLIVHDGDDYLHYAGLQVVLDNLIHRLEIPSMIVVLSNPGDRLAEYAGCERHARFLVEEVLPLVERRYPLVASPSARGLLGASFGAIAALHTAWQKPGVFGRLLLQSGSFGFSDIGDHRRGPLFDPVVRFMNAFRDAPGRPAERIFVSCGIYESLIYENRSMVPLFQRTGMDVRYVEARDGHNWENWRDRLREGLSWLFPGPLWMVYE